MAVWSAGMGSKQEDGHYETGTHSPVGETTSNHEPIRGIRRPVARLHFCGETGHRARQVRHEGPQEVGF